MSQIVEKLGVLPSDQHLFLDGRELTEREATLFTLRVPQQATLILKADCVVDLDTKVWGQACRGADTENDSTTLSLCT